jgi:hypothetical protein
MNYALFGLALLMMQATLVNGNYMWFAAWLLSSWLFADSQAESVQFNEKMKAMTTEERARLWAAIAMFASKGDQE